MKAQNIKMHFLAPAKLKNVNKDGTITTFTNPTEAAKKLKMRDLYKTGRGEMVHHDGK